jgi:hypothetical protein
MGGAAGEFEFDGALPGEGKRAGRINRKKGNCITGG